MAITRKRRRPFVFHDRKFVWDANNDWTLRVASADKKFSISLPAIFPPWPPFSDWPQDRIPIYVAGPEFPGLNGKKDVWIICRTLSVEQIQTTPGFVASLLEWCFDPTTQIEFLEEGPQNVSLRAQQGAHYEKSLHHYRGYHATEQGSHTEKRPTHRKFN